MTLPRAAGDAEFTCSLPPRATGTTEDLSRAMWPLEPKGTRLTGRGCHACWWGQ